MNGYIYRAEPCDTDPDLPICARCQAPVMSLERFDDLAHGARGTIIFVACCHGDSEVVRCDPIEIEAQPYGRIAFGEAFTHLPHVLAQAAR